MKKYIEHIGRVTSTTAPAGNVGEYISSKIAAGSAVSLGTDSPSEVTHIALTTGWWDIGGYVAYDLGATTTVNYIASGSGTSLGTVFSDLDNYNLSSFPTGGQVFVGSPTYQIPFKAQVFISAPVNMILAAQAGFGVSTAKAYGKIWARRVAA